MVAGPAAERPAGPGAGAPDLDVVGGELPCPAGRAALGSAGILGARSWAPRVLMRLERRLDRLAAGGPCRTAWVMSPTVRRSMLDVEVQYRSQTRGPEPGAPLPRRGELLRQIISVLCKLGRAPLRLHRDGRNAFNEDSDDIAATPFARCGADVTRLGEPAQGGGGGS